MRKDKEKVIGDLIDVRVMVRIEEKETEGKNSARKQFNLF
mgnify:CR=1 FL=1